MNQKRFEKVKLIEKRYIIKKRVLYKTVNGHKCIFPRPLARTDMIISAHNAIGHESFKKTKKQLGQNYFWESMNFDIAETLNCCKDCQMKKPFKKATTFNLIKPKFIWHAMSIDVVRPLSVSNLRVKYIIVAIWVISNEDTQNTENESRYLNMS